MHELPPTNITHNYVVYRRRKVYLDTKVVVQEHTFNRSPAGGEGYDEGEEGLHEGLGRPELPHFTLVG